MNPRRICSLFLLLSLAAAFLYKLVFWLLHPMLCWADQSVYLGMAQLFVQGKIPYLDFFDFNLPLIIYLNAFPAAIAKFLCLPPPLTLDLCVLALLAVVLNVSSRVMVLSSSRIDYYTRLPWLFALIIFTQIQNSDFAQREHLFVLLTAPYILLRGLSLESVNDNKNAKLFYTVGTLAAIGANIKPHFLLIIAVFEILSSLDDIKQFSTKAFKARFVRPEIKAFLYFSIIYCLHFLVYPPEAWRVFWQEALPIYLNGSVWFSHTLISSMAGDDECAPAIYGLLIITLVALPFTGKSRLLVPLLGYSYSSLIVYLVTGGTWVYRLLPVQAGSLLLLAVLVGICLANVRVKFLNHWQRLRIIGTVLVVLATGYITSTSCQAYFDYIANVPKISLLPSGYKWQTPYCDFSALYYSILKHSEIGDYVVYMGTGVRPGYPATLQSNRRPGSRYLHGMIVPMVQTCITLKKGTMYTALLAKIMANYGDDIKRNRPRLVYWQNGLTDDFEATAFRQQYLSHYQDMGRLQSMGCTLYKRLDTPDSGGQETAGRAASRRDLLLNVLLKQMTVEECAKKLLLPPKEIDQQVNKLSIVIDQSLSNDAGGGEEELLARVKRSEGEKAILQKTIDKLLDDNLKRQHQ